MKNVKRLVFETLKNGPWEEIFERVKPWYALYPFKNVYVEFQADRMKNVKRLIFEALINRPRDNIFENAETGTQKFSKLFISIYFPGQYSSRLGFFQKYKFANFHVLWHKKAQKGRFEPNKKKNPLIFFEKCSGKISRRSEEK